MQIVNFNFNEFEWMFMIVITFGLLKLIDWCCEFKRLQVILASIVICLSSIYFINYIIKQPKTLVIKYINKNVDENEINISKEQIINDILSGKITQNKNNLKVYTQSIPITEEEYKKLSKYKEEYDKKIENGNVNIIN
jgi:hypothetical protein